MSTIRFPKIGRIVRLDGGSYDVDAIPGLGGPFETATEYFAAWGQAAKFPAGEAYIRSCLPLHVQDEFVVSIREFPHRIAKGGYQITVKNEGPFPLYHPDFRHSNVIIDKNYNILSIIDWENAGTVPWEIIEFPLFLGTLPPPMDLETNYDTEGNPTNEEMQQIWKDRTDYVRDVMHFECRNLSDRSLSTMLASRYTQNIGTAIRLYHESGKLGPYCNVLDKP
ncbi:hypothetical protein N7474_004076 [Penicillium riverlandense]|uniref:uncharacterized protein n=1 Tax=Penicillium riverlandense TaxID=1903569 RepID=UPI0025474233|nr:uncharacterized protein N7474_004076 [Penicillium riverlandense]KAJ5818485.1 hypothetical protein N7474_004076 [Penicillium riverlandense]